jgi:hypothetical protein
LSWRVSGPPAADAAVVLRLRRELLLRPADEELRVRLDPAMVGSDVVGNEIEDEPQPAAGEPLAQPRERRVSAEIVVDAVVAHSETRAAHVGLAEVRQDAPVFRAPLRIRRRNAARGLARLPDAEQPHEVEPVAGERVELLVRDVVQRRGAS